LGRVSNPQARSLSPFDRPKSARVLDEEVRRGNDNWICLA
jgi:hypothetical protein